MKIDATQNGIHLANEYPMQEVNMPEAAIFLRPIEGRRDFNLIVVKQVLSNVATTWPGGNNITQLLNGIEGAVHEDRRHGQQGASISIIYCGSRKHQKLRIAGARVVLKHAAQFGLVLEE